MTRILLTIPALTASAMAQNWVNFSDESVARMRVPGNDPSITVNDTSVFRSMPTTEVEVSWSVGESMTIVSLGRLLLLRPAIAVALHVIGSHVAIAVGLRCCWLRCCCLRCCF